MRYSSVKSFGPPRHYPKPPAYDIGWALLLFLVGVVVGFCIVAPG